jgi:amino acid transporter
VTDFAVYAIFIAVNLSVIVLRRTQPGLPRTIAVPFAYRGVPIPAVLAIGTVVVMLARLESDAWLLGCVALVGAVATWMVLRFVRRNARASSPASP